MRLVLANGRLEEKDETRSPISSERNNLPAGVKRPLVPALACEFNRTLRDVIRRLKHIRFYSMRVTKTFY